MSVYPPRGITPWDLILKAYLDSIEAQPATTTVAGIVELATGTETTTGTDATRAVSPAGLKIVTNLLNAKYVGLGLSGAWFDVVAQFGADPTGVIDSTAAIQAALDAAAAVSRAAAGIGGSGFDASGAIVFFPAGTYITTAPLVNKSQVGLLGTGMRSSRLFNNTTALFAPVGQVQRVSIDRMFLSTGTTGGHLFDMDASAGAAVFWHIERSTLVTRNPLSSIWKQTGVGRSFIEVLVDKCEMDRSSISTVPAWNISMNGNNANNNTWRRSWCHSHNATGAPFFRIESTDAWNYALTFQDLTGEQNGGGFIHLYNAVGVAVDNCPDWDQVGAYQASLYFFNGSAGCKGVSIKHSRRIKSGTLAAGVYDIDAGAGGNRDISVEDCNLWDGTQGVFNLTGYATLIGLAGTASPEGVVKAPVGSTYVRITGGVGGVPLVYTKKVGLGNTGWVSGAFFGSYVNKTAAYTITVADEIVIFNGTSLTATLPPGGSVGIGCQVTVKNINASALTVATSPGLIDGALSISLTQWQSKTFTTDGSNSWITV